MTIRLSKQRTHSNPTHKLHVYSNWSCRRVIRRRSICIVERIGDVGINITPDARLIIPGILGRIVIYEAVSDGVTELVVDCPIVDEGGDLRRPQVNVDKSVAKRGQTHQLHEDEELSKEDSRGHVGAAFVGNVPGA